MTVGQRIAQKRKELGLSQEALGDRLGVSRQSIYKWESDSTLPEVEKLIAVLLPPPALVPAAQPVQA